MIQNNHPISYHDKVIGLQTKTEFFALPGRKYSFIRKQNKAEDNILYRRKWPNNSYRCPREKPWSQDL